MGISIRQLADPSARVPKRDPISAQGRHTLDVRWSRADQAWWQPKSIRAHLCPRPPSAELGGAAPPASWLIPRATAECVSGSERETAPCQSPTGAPAGNHASGERRTISPRVSSPVTTPPLRLVSAHPVRSAVGAEQPLTARAPSSQVLSNDLIERQELGWQIRAGLEPVGGHDSGVQAIMCVP